MAKDSFRATLYLFQGDKQPDILTVRSFAEAVEWASQYERTRVVSDEHPPFWIRPKEKLSTTLEPEADGDGVFAKKGRPPSPEAFDPWTVYTEHKNR